MEQKIEEAQTVPNELMLEAHTFKALQDQVQANTARLNSVDWVAHRTESLLHRDQELRASKQLLLMGWPNIDEKEREKEIKRMASYYGLAYKYQGSTTFKTKNGLARFTIVDMWDKEARNEILQKVKHDPHQVQGNNIVGRPQIPRSRREQDAPMKCAMKTLATLIGNNPKFSPTWEIQALWHEEWLLAVTNDDKDITQVQLYVPETLKADFESKFAEDWSGWTAPGTSKHTRPQHHLQIRILTLTEDMKTKLDSNYAALRQKPKAQDVDMQDAEASSRATPAKGGGKRRWLKDTTLATQQDHNNKSSPTPAMTNSLTTITHTTITSRLPMHRPEGKPGEPRDPTNTTTSCDHYFAKKAACSLSQRLQQRHPRSNHKRGKRSLIAETIRKAERSNRRCHHRRWYRWCKSNVGINTRDLDRHRLGSGSLDSSKTIASQPLNNALTAGSFLYEEHSENRKRSPLLNKIKYGDTLCIGTLNACSLVKSTMRHQLVHYMHTKKIDILCLQEMKAKQTSFYMVNKYTFFTFSTALQTNPNT